MSPSNRKKNNLLRGLGSLGTSFLRMIPPEPAHNLAGEALKRGLIPFKVRTQSHGRNLNFSSRLRADIHLDHPIGLAAGFDKNAEYLPGLSKLGFSFIEVGAATPLPQSGNPKPRLFRLKEKKALINRMGFNNDGIECINERLHCFSKKRTNGQHPLISLNIGVNKKTPIEKALEDYIVVLQKATAPLSYYAINLSSPNTASLKHLCNRNSIQKLAQMIKRNTDKPLESIWIKLGPNLEEAFFKNIVESVSDFGFGGLVLTNTFPVNLPEKGGLSGQPLLSDSTRALEWAWDVHRGTVPMIAVGGIQSGKDIFEKVLRGASLVQIYTSFIYRGPHIVEYLLEELEEVMKHEGVKSLSKFKGSFY